MARSSGAISGAGGPGARAARAGGVPSRRAARPPARRPLAARATRLDTLPAGRYAESTACQQQRRTGMIGYPVIDGDGHLTEPDGAYRERLPEPYRSARPLYPHDGWDRN